MPIQKILVGYDGTESSEHALEFSTDIAKQQNMELHIAFVVREPIGMADPIPDEVYQTLVNVGQKTLSNAIQQVKKQFVKYMTHLEDGDPGPKLLELADKIKPDLIALGIVRHSPSERVLGTVSSYLSGRYPLLLVP